MNRKKLINEIRLLEEAEKRKKEFPLRYLNRYAWQTEWIYSSKKFNLLTQGNQCGKASLLDTDIVCVDGLKKARDVVIGDLVYGSNGKLTRVVDIPFIGKTFFYRVTFNDGSSTCVSRDHLWICKGSRERFLSWGKKSKTYGMWLVKSTKEIIDIGGYAPAVKNNKDKFVIPVSKPIRRDRRNLSIHPYLVGLFLGDGCVTNTVTISTTNKELQSLLSRRFKGTVIKDNRTVRFNQNYLSELKELGLHGCRHDTKFIPNEYLVGSIPQRRLLLAGLMDTDGTIEKNGNMYYSTTSPRLAEDVKELACSLGYKSRLKWEVKKYTYKGEKLDGKPCCRVYLFGNYNPCLIEKKRKRYRAQTRYSHVRVIEKIEPIGEKMGKCITVSNSDSSYLIERDHIVTHNSFSNIWKQYLWATEKSLWPKLWKDEPTQFWYFYPNQKTINREFLTKWEKKLLPSGSMKDDPVYGWSAEKQGKDIVAVHYNSGVSTYFFSYEMKPSNLQSSSVYAAFLDEEMPMAFYDEIIARLRGVGGYFNMVATPTLGQDFWKNAIMPEFESERILPQAKVVRATLWDCLEFEDGSPGLYTKESVERAEAECSTEDEKRLRIYGDFIIPKIGLVYTGFDNQACMVDDYHIGKNWRHYSGLDYGSGGESGHPSATLFVAVDPKFRKGVVYLGWRGDGIQTTAGDLLDKNIELKGQTPLDGCYYDHACRDLKTISDRMDYPIQGANKSRDEGSNVLNTLFKKGCLKVKKSPELFKLAHELSRLKSDTPKQRAKDDLIDALRYCCMGIPWDLTYITRDMKNEERINNNTRRQPVEKSRTKIDIDNELNYWNDMMF